MLQSREKYIDDLPDLPAALRSYIPKQLLKNVKIKDCWNMFNELGYIQNLLDDSNDNWRMYGSAESLLKNLKVYMKFPLSRKMFPRGMRRYYNAIPNSYQTLKKEVLYCKQDFLFYLQCCVYEELELHDDEHKVGYAELVEYMRKHEERLSGCYEFVKYDHYVFEDIRKPFIRSRSLYVFPRNPKNAVVTGNPRVRKCLSEFMYRQKVCMHNRAKPCDDCLEAINETEAIVEAEIKAETEQASSSVTAATSGDGAKNEEDSEESEPESVTSQALSVPRSNSKELQISIALSPVKTKTKPSSAILESEVPEHCQVLSVSTTEICLRLHVHEEKSNKSVEMEKKIKDLEKEAEEWKKMHFKVLEENIALDSQVKEKNEQLKLAQKALQENEQKFKELEKAVKKQRQELTKFEKSVKQESKNLKSKMNGLLSQLVEKDIEIDELKKENLDDYKKFEAFNLDLERRLNVELEQQKDHKKEIEQLKRNAFTSADELKKLTAKIAEKEAAEDLLKRSNKGLLEKLRKSDSNLQEITNRRIHLETEVIEKNRVILGLQKSIEKLEKSKKEHEARISKILAVCIDTSPPEPIPEEKPDTECLICLLEMKPDQKTLKCDHCRKIMHLKCAADWHKVKRSCAHCRREQLDPNEFPNLQ